jgi:hypothetical protein
VIIAATISSAQWDTVLARLRSRTWRLHGTEPVTRARRFSRTAGRDPQSPGNDSDPANFEKPRITVTCCGVL